MIDISTARRFMTGRTPGNAATIGSTSEFGSASKWSGWAAFGTRVNILVRVASSTWISRPIFSCVRAMVAL